MRDFLYYRIRMEYLHVLNDKYVTTLQLNPIYGQAVKRKPIVMIANCS